MTLIRQEDFIQSIANTLQFMACHHPRDYIQALAKAYEREESPAAKDAMAQILYNSRLCAQGLRPICQDTGMVVAFITVGIREFEVEDMPVTVAVDASGASVHDSGPAQWRIPVSEIGSPVLPPVS